MTRSSNPDKSPLACVVLAAGQGTRMKSELHKVLHPVAGMPMIKHVLKACEELAPEKIIVVVPPDADDVKLAVAPHISAVQHKALGTGDAVKSARKQLEGFSGDVIVLYGDTPLVTAEALKGLMQKRLATGAAIVVSGFVAEDKSPYGRLVVDKTGILSEIVEAKDASPEQLEINLCNGGIMLFSADKLWPLLDRLEDNNAKREYYLTDCVKLARLQGWICSVRELTADDVLGVNTRVDLAKAEKLMQRRLCGISMLNGTTMIDPESVHMSFDTKIGRDVVIEPNVFFGVGVEIADKVNIRSFSHLEGVKVEVGATIGPFARLRPGSVIGAEARIGNFVEIKKTEVGKSAKIGHLSYIGDATVGEKANIGAGTITCNYDGFSKFHTNIGAGAFIGSNTALVAPVSVGNGAYVGAGSTITMSIPDNALAVARGRQSNFEKWASRFRDAQKAKEKK